MVINFKIHLLVMGKVIGQQRELFDKKEIRQIERESEKRRVLYKSSSRRPMTEKEVLLLRVFGLEKRPKENVKLYLKNQRKIKALFGPKDRVKILRIIAEKARGKEKASKAKTAEDPHILITGKNTKKENIIQREIKF